MTDVPDWAKDPPAQSSVPDWARDPDPDSGGAPSSLWDAFSGREPGQIKTDAGPAITWGQQQVSPGLPAVKERAEKWSESANKNLIEPITHPIETVKNIGKLGAGLAQYTGVLPGEDFKPDVAALAADYKKTYGSMEGFKNALWDDPFRVAGDAMMGRGVLTRLGRRAGVLPRPAAPVEAPSVEALRDSAEGHYNAMHGFGVELHPQVMADTAQNIFNELDAVGYDEHLAPHTYRIVERLRNPPGPTTTTMNVESVRRQLNKAAGLPGERDAARRAIEEIDTTMAGLTPADAVVNGHFAPRVSQEALAARGDYSAAKHAETVENATNNAELQAASTGSGANIDNATRQKFRAILTSPTKRRGFSQESLDLMESLVRGTPVGNAARFLGKLAPSGIVSGGLSAALGHAVGHTIGVPALGYLSKATADAATRRAAARISEQVRLRSPEARRIGAVRAPGPNIGRGLVNWSQLGRMLNQGNPDQGQADGGAVRAVLRRLGGRIGKEGGGELSDEVGAPASFWDRFTGRKPGQIVKSDDSGPPISWGQQQFSPGLDEEKYPFVPRMSDFNQGVRDTNEASAHMLESGAEGMRSGNPLKMGLGAATSAVAPLMPLMAPFGGGLEAVRKAAARTGPGLEHAVDVASWVNPETLVAGAGKMAMAVAPTVRAARLQAEAAEAAAAAANRAVNAEGKPALVYRGEHGELPEGQQFQSRTPGLTFTDNPEVANTYAMQPNNRYDTVQAPRVTPANLDIKNPIIENRDDPFVDLSNLEQKLGRKEAMRIAKKFDSDIRYTGNWEENYAGKYDNVADLLKQKPGELKNLYFDSYKYLDDPAEVARLKKAGYDGAIHMGNGESATDLEYRVFDPSQVKSALGPKPGADNPGVGVSEGNAHGFVPDLRVRADPATPLPEKSLFTQKTNNANAARQIDSIDPVLQAHPDATESPENWSNMMAHALATRDVPVPPYALIKDLSGDAQGAIDKVKSLSPGQIEDANHGFQNAREFRRAYENGELSVETTGKLFLWSFLSRGVSPYTQEGLFIDSFKGIDPWIKKAADGQLTKQDMAAYNAWASTAAPKGSGQPGAGATHNLNAFGNLFLMKMGERGEDGVSHLQRIHDMMSDPNATGQQIRREFMKVGEGVGIDNKVVSFTLLVAGHDDVMVIDRVQTRQLFDDGRFAGKNIYDGQKNDEGNVITGTALANLTYGARGLLVYEAIERGLQQKINAIYGAAGRPQDASVGRYHWESWVAHSQQEASHGTLDAILSEAKGNKSALTSVAAKQGEYGAFEYGARYGRDAGGQPFYRYTVPSGKEYDFSVPAFRSFMEEIKKPATGVVPTKFKVTEAGNEPWYKRSGVNTGRLEERAKHWSDRPAGGEGARAVRAPGNGEAVSDRARRATVRPLEPPERMRGGPVRDHREEARRTVRRVASRQ